MRKRFLIPVFIIVLLTGCGNNTATWQDATKFGDIDIEASIVDTNDVEDECKIDEYVNIVELNETPLDKLNIETFSLPYNQIAEQCGLEYIKTYSIKPEVKYSQKIYTITQDYYGLEVRADESKNTITSLFSQVLIEDDYGTEKYYEAMNRILAPIMGGVPNMKKYDLNKIYFEIVESMKETGGEYETSYNGIKITLSRDYNWVSIYIEMPKSYNNE